MRGHQQGHEVNSSDLKTVVAEELHRAITHEREHSHVWREGCRDDCKERRDSARLHDESVLRYFSPSV
jgi:hypothetical protein